MLVVSVAGDTTLTVVRGRALTTAASHVYESEVSEHAATSINQAGGLPSNLPEMEQSWATFLVDSVQRARIGRLSILQVSPETDCLICAE